jgi:hypothetical protein
MKFWKTGRERHDREEKFCGQKKLTLNRGDVE